VIRDAFLGRMERFEERNHLERPLRLIAPPQENDFPSLNESQVNAATIALQNHFSMIQGPPGTGKTTVIAALAHSFVRQGEKVLIVAHTNVAIDFVTLQVANAGLKPIRVLALSIERPNPDIEEFTSRSEAEKNPELRLTEPQVIQRADVVLTTTGCIGGYRFKGITFRKVIIDESSQCVDPDLLRAVVRGCDQLIPSEPTTR
jgi:regulator of nonsense transcripts 1